MKHAGLDISWESGSLRWAVALAALVLVIGIVVAVFLGMCTTSTANPDTVERDSPAGQRSLDVADNAAKSSAPSVRTTGVSDVLAEPDEAFAAIGSYALSAADALSIPDCEVVTSLNVRAGQKPASLDEPKLQPVTDAVADIEERGPCGFVFLDVGKGHGLAYNTGEVMYVASSAKAVMAYYALSQDAVESDAHRRDVETFIVDSDNDAFEDFGYAYADADYDDWLAERDVDYSHVSGDLYPQMSARSLAGIWAEILQYVRDESDDANWLADLLGSTSVSYIRDAVEGEGATVMNKAGWIADWECNSVTDAAIVQAGGHSYLMVIVTGQSDSEEAEQAVTDLARALFALRGDM